MNKLIFCITIALSLNSSMIYAQIDLQLETTIKDVVQGFKNRNTSQVQKHIHTKYGFIYWNKIGVPINQGVYAKNEFIFPKQGDEPNQWFYETPKHSQPLINTSRLPTMDCERWNKFGFFYTHSVSHPFSDLSKSNQSIIETSDRELAQQLKQVQPFERKLVEMQYVGKSRKIGDDLHLFFSYIEGQWYFSALDNAGQCDA